MILDRLGDSSSGTHPQLLRDEASGVVVREAAFGDVPAMAEVGSGRFRDLQPTLPQFGLRGDVGSRFEVSRIRKGLSKSDERWLVAVSDATLGGFAQLVRAESSFDGQHCPIELRALHVVSSWSVFEAGSLLLRGCRHLARQLGYRQLWACVREDYDHSLQFFCDRGFEPVGREIICAGTSRPTEFIVLARSIEQDLDVR